MSPLASKLRGQRRPHRLALAGLQRLPRHAGNPDGPQQRQRLGLLLTFDTTPGYTDTTPFPATLAQWKYRAIFRVDDAQVGQWSTEVSVTVGG